MIFLLWENLTLKYLWAVRNSLAEIIFKCICFSKSARFSWFYSLVETPFHYRINNCILAIIKLALCLLSFLNIIYDSDSLCYFLFYDILYQCYCKFLQDVIFSSKFISYVPTHLFKTFRDATFLPISGLPLLSFCCGLQID